MSGVVNQSITRIGRYEPFELQVARGQITFHTAVSIFGYQPSVGTTFIPVWENAAGYSYPGSAVVMTLASSSAADTAVIVQISGLDSGYNQISENVALNGTTGVLTTNSYLRINSLRITSGNAAGTVTAKNGGTTYGQINIGVGRSQASIYTVPAGYTFYLERSQVFSGLPYTSSTILGYRVYQSSSTGTASLLTQRPFVSNFTVDRIFPTAYPEKTDIQWQLNTSTGTASIGFAGEGVLIANDGTL